MPRVGEVESATNNIYNDNDDDDDENILLFGLEVDLEGCVLSFIKM